MKELNYQLKELCKRNRDGSFSVQNDREYILQRIAKDLVQLDYINMQVTSLKEKHINALVKHWQKQGLTVGTIKNRMSKLRWWVEKIHKSSIIAKSNSHYGIEKRVYATNTSKALTLDLQKLNNIHDPYIVMSLRLQAAFGLRRQESIKFIPDYADQGGHIRLKGSWCKGGKPRTTPIINQQQRNVLDEAKSLFKKGSLIPPDKNYIQQLKHYENTLSEVGLHKQHGLRHHYAQQRYQTLTGRLSPAQGGLTRFQLNPEQKLEDKTIRLQISKELGHERESITVLYLGR